MSRTATYVQQGARINFTAGSDIAAGTPVKIANGLYGIADHSIASGETGALTIEGVYRFTAAGSISKGAPVYLSSGKVTSSAGEGTCVGVALEAATQEGDEILVKLNALPSAPVANFTSVAAASDAAPVTTEIADAAAKTAIEANAAAINALIDKLVSAGVFTE